MSLRSLLARLRVDRRAARSPANVAPSARPAATGGRRPNPERKRLIEAVRRRISARRRPSAISTTFCAARRRQPDAVRALSRDAARIRRSSTPSRCPRATFSSPAACSRSPTTAPRSPRSWRMRSPISPPTTPPSAPKWRRRAALFTRVSTASARRPEQGEEDEARIAADDRPDSRASRNSRPTRSASATIAKAGYDPYAASRFSNRSGAGARCAPRSRRPATAASRT